MKRMLINRRLYLFEKDPRKKDSGRLILAGRSGKAFYTGKATSSVYRIDTMTGKKEVTQYYDEFESAEPDLVFGGSIDAPQWLEVKPQEMI